MRYRADIDGLRAVAVLAVILNHAGFSLFSGGYIGVDIFFVISGFLITDMLIREIEQSNFSVIRFYERRIRRIFPALFGTLSVTLALGLWLYDARDLFYLGKNLAATSLFYSNIWLHSQAGYFAPASQINPLLHTWSLAVEEQFYIFFPPLLFFLHKYAKPYRNTFLLLSACTSLVFAAYYIYYVDEGAVSAFYLIQFRAWELFAGTLLALGFIPVLKNSTIRNIASFLGFSLILTPVFTYTETTPFPGISALPPILGAVLIIHSGSNETGNTTWVNKLLAFTPLVFTGLISYSLYLWHWPLIVFIKYSAIRPLYNSETWLTIAVIFTISVLSWKFIETPFRMGMKFTTPNIFAYAITGIVLFMFLGNSIVAKNGFASIPYFAPPLVTEDFFPEKCNLGYRDINSPQFWDLCMLGKQNKKSPVQFILWGDSHAKSAAFGLDIAAKKYGLKGALASISACPPVLEENYQIKPKCVEINNKVIEQLAASPNIKYVFLVARWHKYFEDDPQDTISIGFEKTVEQLILQRKDIIIFNPVPEAEADVPSAVFIARRTGRDANSMIGQSVSDYIQENNIFNKAMAHISPKYDLTIIDVSKIFCPTRQCIVESSDGKILYKDDNHLSVDGAALLAPVFESIFEQARP